ncbi:MAG: RIP metalloprotease RseP [Candidatus Pacebacteria bacterium]|nr:RIP metalloprotease RseP [Candidatus Paceibacterota bacterium]
MNILLFIIVLGVLVFVHELGHFLFAKLFNIRVDEFGFGYPPKMFKMFRWKGTDFTMNWIPFGGFVKIFGEADDGEELSEEDKQVSLVHKPRWQQFLVMFGGILFNVIFAWILFSAIYMSGVTAPIESAPDNYSFEETRLVVSGVMQDSPADLARLIPGDEVKELFNDTGEQITITNETITEVSEFINLQGELGGDVGFIVLRNDDQLEIIEISPEEGLIEGKYGVGIGLERVGELQLPFHQALVYGAKNTWNFTVAITQGFGQLITGQISADNVSGPVGIVKQIGDASAVGISYLIGFTALLSLNLAVLNLIPFPALDGGRILIILIESIIGRRLNPNIVNWVNVIGFFILIALMLLVTANDIIKLF